MRVNGQGPVHRGIGHHLARGIIQVVVATNNMGHTHIMVINHNCQHIDGGTIRAQQNHVIQLIIANGDIALHLILDHGDAVNG